MTRNDKLLLAACSALALSGCAAGVTSSGDMESAAQAPRSQDELLAEFMDPPKSARPRTWWHWMNGNVTQEGIAKDLEWMSRIGLGGFQTFDASLQTPQIVDKRLVYMTPEWREAFRFAASEAKRHDLEMAIAASPGWSETGGPWVNPEQGMKKLVWGETLLKGGRAFSGILTPPPSATGPYLDTPFEDELSMLSEEADSHVPVASGRIAVIAVPLTAPAMPPAEFALENKTRLPVGLITDASLDTTVDIPLDANANGAVYVTYPEEVTLRSTRVFLPGLARPFRGVPIKAALEVSQGGAWRQIAELPLGAVPTTVGFDAVTGSKFRLVLSNNPPPPGGGNPDIPAPGAESFDIFSFGKLDKVPLAELQLSGEPRLDLVEQKAGFGTAPDYFVIMDDDAMQLGAAPSQIIDLTDKVGADGRLEWTPPKGQDWKVYRFGWSLTGKTNHPATPEATGLEVDKFDPAAVRNYLETYLAMYRETLGDDLYGGEGLQALLTDSIEVGASNWTPAMEQEFARRRGYALRPWLPALAGTIIGSPERTERFLYDFRQTLAELLADYHYGTVAEVAHENGLKIYGEALENGRPMLGDDLAMRSHADVPMAAMWTWFRNGAPRWSLLGDMKGAASVAHVYGQNLVAAESMTSANAPWAFSPRDLKRVIDFEFAYGINRPVIHTSVHVPVEDHKPGLSLMIFGQYFNRNETWAEMAGPWVDYMARSAYLLQHGRYVADVAIFSGEEAPLTAQFAGGPPKGLPTRYAFDFVNPAMLKDAVSLENGQLVTLGGTRYRMLFFGEKSRRMTLPTLQRVAELAQAGVAVAGVRPESSPSLADDPQAFASLAEQVWALPNVSTQSDAEAALAASGLAPDFAVSGASDGGDILFLHRRSDEADIYFVNNRLASSESIEARFRVSGKAPELWDAITGTGRPLSYRIEGDVTVVPLDLGPEDAKFVVFRHPASGPSRSVAEQASRPAGEINGPWSVSFQEGRGAPPSITMTELKPLNEHQDAGVRYFSGVATYRTTFTPDRDALKATSLWLDLGQVADVAEVFVNGERAGVSWFAPDKLQIGQLVRRGENLLEIRVANRWINRLIGDKQEDAVPVSFTAAPTYRPDASLVPSGLIGPVTIEARD